MVVLASALDPASQAFRASADAMASKLAEVRSIEDKIRLNSDTKRPLFEARGQLTPRERVARLLDPGTLFLDLMTLAGLGMHDDDGGDNAMGGGTIAGIGMVAGRRCIVSASDSGIKGGSIPPIGLRKTLRLHEIAFENRLPLIYLVESGGANLAYQAEMFVEGGRAFANQARLSAAGIPQIAIVHGSSTAGGAYLPGLSDYVVLVRNRSKVFLAGPPLVKAAIGEDTDDETLGGADMHGAVTGLGEYVAEDDAEAICIGREIMKRVGRESPVVEPDSDARSPAFDADDLMGIVPSDPRWPFDMKEVLARILDGSEFFEFKAGYGREMVCGHGAIKGHQIGVLANNGAIRPSGSLKAAQFVQLCDQAGIPLIFLQNTTGYMVGSATEREGAVKHGSKMIQAVANARVPKITIVIGGSFGAGNYGMCGRGFSPRFIFSWPSARTAVMGGGQAAKVMEIVARGAAARKGVEADEEALAKQSAKIRDQIDAQSTALYSTARLWDDGIIDPRDTRRVLGLCLSIAAEGELQALRPNTFGVARG